MKEEVISVHYEKRRDEHFRKMRLFEKEAQLMKRDTKSSGIFSDFKPQLSPLLSRAELQTLFDECFKRTRVQMQKKEKASIFPKPEPKRLKSQRSTAELFKLAKNASTAAVKFKMGINRSQINLLSALKNGAEISASNLSTTTDQSSFIDSPTTLPTSVATSTLGLARTDQQMGED